MSKHQGLRRNVGDNQAFVADWVNDSLQQNCTFISTVLDIMDALLVVLDTNGRIVLFNQACEKLTGYTFAEVIGRDVVSLFILPGERDGVQKMADKLLSGGVKFPVTHQNFWLTKDGAKRLVSWSNTVLTDDEGNVQFIVSSGTDITEQEQDRQALEHSERLFYNLFERANDAIFLSEVMPDGSLSNYIEVNNLACEKLGYTREEFKKLSPATFPIVERKQQTKEIEKCIDSGCTIWDVTMLAKDGREVPFELNAHIFQANDRAFCLAICRDITERKKAEAVLKESEERYRNLVELSPDAIFVHQGGRFIYANTASARLFRAKDPAWLIGKPIEELVPPDRKETFFKNMASLKGGEKEQCIAQGKVVCYDGTVLDVDIACSMLTYHGEPAIQVIVRDISHRKKSEYEMLKASKLQSLGTLAGSIAHEYNNLLTVILGNLSIARMYADHDSKATEILQEVEDAAIQARELTQRLRTFARGGSPVKKALNLRNLLFKTGLDLLDDGHINYNLKIPGDLLPLEADEAQLCQAMNDIMLNAVQAMPQGGAVDIVAENITSEGAAHLALEDGLYVKISITDEGPGIAEEELTTIFDPFYTTKPESDGLGLSTAYSIINKHGGHLTVESVQGEGATFIIYLPAMHSMELPHSEEEKEYSGTGKILVMEDEPAIRKTVEEMLSLLGYDAVTAADGTEALKLYQEAKEHGEPFERVILDLMVAEGMGGKETIEKLQELDPHVKSYVSSGYSNDPVISHYREYGFCGCIPKPYTIEQLGAALKRA
ncbi:PAS domain-containing hybrid sensor histidine kinase/response regulator [Dethiobacter alkaliphilus]|uniref:PAS domain-containing hybrid sensor histidine kinase/response regulator n=1 Tax=Dethiobacter alkaliphilus TaxID=427926 RepID=UPI00222749F1|nr:PAS domain-containing sensor histidine kinase [Dethiobacter alkaliphilus]MCW3490531.1 PAS domain S-box protein [Dethiobacter alkaliphilus]